MFMKWKRCVKISTGIRLKPCCSSPKRHAHMISAVIALFQYSVTFGSFNKERGGVNLWSPHIHRTPQRVTGIVSRDGTDVDRRLQTGSGIYEQWFTIILHSPSWSPSDNNAPAVRENRPPRLDLSQRGYSRKMAGSWGWGSAMVGATCPSRGRPPARIYACSESSRDAFSLP